MTSALFIAIASSSQSGAAGTAAGPSTDSRALALVSRVTAPVHHCTARKAVRFYRTRVNYWRERMGTPVLTRSPSRLAGCPRFLAHALQRKAYGLRRAYEKWQRERRAYFHRLYEKWRCIHEREGAWNANTGNGYYGGLQMTLWFQQTYGPEFYRRWGTADRWPVWAQLTAAERAYQSDGDYGQWGTAPACGLPT